MVAAALPRSLDPQYQNRSSPDCQLDQWQVAEQISVEPRTVPTAKTSDRQYRRESKSFEVVEETNSRGLIV